MFSQRDVDDLNKYLEKNPEEMKLKTRHDQDYEELNKTINDLKAKGIVTDEKGASQDMAHKSWG